MTVGETLTANTKRSIITIQVRILSGLQKVRLEVGNPPEERSSFGGVKSENK